MTDTAKKRISSVAKEHEVTSDLFMRLLKDAGVEAKSPSSMIDAEGMKKVQPFLRAERDRKEREELVKAGKKIPMKAVLKKAPAIPPPPPPAPKPVAVEVKEVPVVKAVEPTPAPKPGVVEERAVVQPVPDAKVEEKPEIIKLVAPVVPVEVAPVAPVAVVEPPAPKTIATPAEAQAKARELHSELKVSVEKPDAALLARIAKTKAENL